MSALASIRDDAHRLLTALGPGLDPALLGHRVALDEPEDAERHLEALLAAEITAMISDREVGAHSDYARIQEWLEAQPDLPGGGMHPSVTAEERLAFVQHGLGDNRLTEQEKRTGKSKSALKKLRYRATELFSATADEATQADMALAERMVIRTRYSKPSPILRLGTVLEHGGAYFLCVQPVCDSVRLTTPTQFPLLALAACGSADTGEGVIALRDPGQDGGWQRLKIQPKASELRLVTFDPEDRRVVEAQDVDGRPRFRVSPEGNYRWVADLKTEHAQRAAEQLGSSLSRVGLTESEPMRLRNPS
jgi:hypothetical protein